MPLITVGIPTYNRSAFLAQAVISVQQQNYPDVEILIVDNASTDDTFYVCQELAKNDKRIRYVRNSQNLGMAGNWKRIAELTNTPYLKYLMDDDLLLPECLGEFASAAQQFRESSLIACLDISFRDGEEVAICKQPIYVPERPIQGKAMLKYLVQFGNAIGCPTNVMFRTDALRLASRVWENVSGKVWVEDVQGMAHALEQGDFYCINRPLVAIRRHAGTGTAALTEREKQIFEKKLLLDLADLSGAAATEIAYAGMHEARSAYMRAIWAFYRFNFHDVIHFLHIWINSPYALWALKRAWQVSWYVLLPRLIVKPIRLLSHWKVSLVSSSASNTASTSSDLPGFRAWAMYDYWHQRDLV